MIYPDGAFAGYDTILACGSHHVQEIQAMNQLTGANKRRAIPVGYGKIDMQLRWKTEQQWENPHCRIAKNTVLIAPSWGQKNIIESMGLELVGKLRKAGIGVTLRPHPGILRNNLQAVAEIRERFDSDDGFTYENPSDKSASFFYSDLMISDYSGVAFEYAFVMER
ncbi:MAG: CDP-glycerol glycerophosphotransferase family protein, partial [Verrucomicrobiota bacterium]|nr:CDP-glycerol glycerophosphotransferase family protein [Verrucomicrobiota bacterium]